MSENRGLVPIVITDTVKATRREMFKYTGNEYAEKGLESLEQDNPILGICISEYASGCRNPEEIKRVGVNVYKLLKRRAYEQGDILPIVTKDTSKTVQKLMSGYPVDESVEKVLGRLGEDNPLIKYLILEEYATESENPRQTIYMGVLVHELLEIQARADKLEKEVKLLISPER